MALVVLLAYQTENFFILIPLALFVGFYVTVDTIHRHRSDRNLIKAEYAVQQNNYFEEVRKEANKIMDLMEARQNNNESKL